MNTPEEKILKETLQYNEISHEVSVSPFCLKNVPEHPENKENLDLPSNWASYDTFGLSSVCLEKPMKMEEEIILDGLKMTGTMFKSPMRSLSFEDNEYIVTDFKPNLKPQTKGINENYLLDTNQNNCNPDIPTISCHTLKQLLNKEIFNEKEVIIIDCRYFYEYDGGHIENALNITNPCDIENIFFAGAMHQNLQINLQRENYIIIFHCEFSQKRGPKMYRFFRKKDREINEEKYPFLTYPHIYLLDGGYNKFVKYNPGFCSNSGRYVSMFDKIYKEECVQATAEYNRVWKNKKKEKINPLNLIRKHSF